MAWHAAGGPPCSGGVEWYSCRGHWVRKLVCSVRGWLTQLQRVCVCVCVLPRCLWAWGEGERDLLFICHLSEPVLS